MPQLYPIWISGIGELDLVYEGTGLIMQNLHLSYRCLLRDIEILNKSLEQFLRDEKMDTAIAQETATTYREKKAVLNQLQIKIEKIQRFRKRLIDPSVPQELIDDWKDRKRRENLLDLARRQE